jgi:hypothetical protein
MLRNYTRWRQGTPGQLYADILGARVQIEVNTEDGRVLLDGTALSPDEARLIGVRLIDAAVLADGDRAIRKPPTDDL